MLPKSANGLSGYDAKTQRVIELVKQGLAEAPFPHDGVEWVAASQPEWAAELGFSVETFRRIISKPPFDRDRKLINGKTVCLVRIGEKRPHSHKRIANTIAKIWKSKTGLDVDRHYYGCFYGCAETWPADCAVDIFKCVLANWEQFASVAKDNLWAASASKGKEPHAERHYKYPSPSFIRKTTDAAIEFYIMQMQHAGQTLPPSLSHWHAPNKKLKVA